MASNWLKFQDDKTEFITLGMPANLIKVVNETINVQDHLIDKCHYIRNIRAIFDFAMTMEVRMNRVSPIA